MHRLVPLLIALLILLGAGYGPSIGLNGQE
jgi:hypothetical protein